MKKLLAFVMAAAMTLSLAACGGGSSSSAGTSTPAGTSSAPAASSTPADTADFKVGAIYINGQNDTAGYTFQHHSGITKAMENLGLDPASQLLIVDNVAEDYTAVSNAIDTLAGQGANIIFGISFGYIDAMNDKAEEYPEIIFSHATGYMGNDTNFNNYFGRIYQARYLTGVAAGLKSLEMGNNSIGYVAAYEPGVCRDLLRHQRLRPGRAGRQPRRRGPCEQDLHLGRREPGAPGCPGPDRHL